MAREGQTVLLAGPGAAAFEYRVERVWYHPAVLRDLGEGIYAKSEDPRDGEVAFNTADVAVIRLTSAGPRLRSECRLATREEIANLSGRPVGLVAYAFDGAAAIQRGVVEPGFATGRVIRATDLGEGRGLAAAPGSRFMIHDAVLGSGSSGGPLFIGNGHVIGIQNEGGFARPRLLAGGCSTECLRELLAYHKLWGLMLGDERAPTSHWSPDPRLPARRLAARLVHQADCLRRGGRFFEASLQCNRAATLSPESPGVYLQRSKIYLYYCGLNWRKLNRAERERFAILAYEDSKRCLELDADRCEAYLLNAQAAVYWVYTDPRPDWLQTTLSGMDALLMEAPFDEPQRAWMLNARAQIYVLLGDKAAAERDYRGSLRLDPNQAQWHRNRAEFWDWCGRPDLAAEDRAAAKALEQ